MQTWNVTEYTVSRSHNLKWTAGGIFRFGQTVGDLYDRRAATELEYTIGKGLAVGGRYLFRSRREGDSFVNENRFVAGISYPIVQRAIEVQGTTLYERHVVPSSDFNRYKQEFEVYGRERLLSPWLYQQFTFKQGEGFVRSRSRLGLLWKVSSYEFKAAYQFESLSIGTAWAPRHAIYTEVSIDRPAWARD